jgi:ABC-type phosphate transport system auxiliary subunit
MSFNGYYRDEQMSERVFNWIKALEKDEAELTALRAENEKLKVENENLADNRFERHFRAATSRLENENKYLREQLKVAKDACSELMLHCNRGGRDIISKTLAEIERIGGAK